MIAKFPEKLLKLRKHFKYSQQEIARLCNVDLIAYMSWENGRSLPTIDEIIKLSEIYGLTVDEIISNSDEIPFFNYDLEDDFPLNPNTPTKKIKEDENLEHVVVNEKKVSETTKQPISINETQVFSKKELSIEKEKSEIKKDKISILNNLSNKNKMIIGIGVAFLLMIIVISALVDDEKSSTLISNQMEETNRLSAENEYTLLINNDGTVESYGKDNVGQMDVTSWNEVTSVVSGENHSVGLLEDGKVIGAGSNGYGQLDFSAWNNVVDISVGKNHTIGLTSDNKAVCVGDNLQGQCEVEEWEDLKLVKAGVNSTIAITNDSQILSTREFEHDLDKFSNLDNIVDVVYSDSVFIALLDNNTAVCTSINETTACDIENIKNLKKVVVNEEAVVGLLTTGEIILFGDVSYAETDVELLSDIIAVALGDEYLVALTNNNEVIGLGNATNHPFSEEEAKQIPSVQNLSVEIDTTVKIRWDSVSEASYYELNIEGIGDYKLVNNELSLPLNLFEDETVYSVSVVAATNDSSLESSDESVYVFTFIEKETEQTTTSASQIIVSSLASTTSTTTAPTSIVTSTVTTEESTTEVNATEDTQASSSATSQGEMNNE